MYAIENYEDIISRLTHAFLNRYPGRFPVKMFGILFAPPHTKLARESIIPSLSHLHHRSENEIDFFCMGYASKDIYRSNPDDALKMKIECDSGTVFWEYSDAVFNQLRKDFEKRTKWRYSGECDLLLVNAIFDFEDNTLFIDFSKVVWLTLHSTLIDNPDISVGTLFENICSFADNSTSDNPVNDFSDSQGLKRVGKATLESVADGIKKLPGKIFQKAHHFRVINIERKDSIPRVTPARQMRD